MPKTKPYVRSALREYEDWLFIIGTILAGLSQVTTDDIRLTIAILILSSIGKSLLSIVASIRESEAMQQQ